MTIGFSASKLYRAAGMDTMLQLAPREGLLRLARTDQPHGRSSMQQAGGSSPFQPCANTRFHAEIQRLQEMLLLVALEHRLMLCAQADMILIFQAAGRAAPIANHIVSRYLFVTARQCALRFDADPQKSCRDS